MFNRALFQVVDFDNRCTLRWASGTIPSLLEAPSQLGRSASNAALDVAPVNSIHVAIRFEVRGLFLRAAGFASDKCKDIQNRGETANVSRNTHEPIFHAGMFVR